MDQSIFLIVIIVAFAAFMFYSSRKRKKQQAELQTKMQPGARVMLSFGLYGTLLSVDDEKVTADVEIAPGTVVTVHRQTLSRVVDDNASDVDETVTTDDAAAAPVLDLGKDDRRDEPEFGQRVEPTETDAAKRKTED
ncbi:preprotein translocase subunit YajC [Curtobacterium sp. C1]|uniref:Preprotein translocase subunit YajC n=1 Tax=Curtobacterium citreum TaxID=2036 RepID=A0A850DRL7_9MICO|nr:MULTISPECIES: preprotein translocase subunit YajC [Curtobacterium]NUU28196.1 preprotein translocase subunit YajC [Curtobacterium albidum]UFU15692.1 preprotein translocase subunit YajC [Curtobacterium sp. C1]WIJ46960.1 preprotein translocase subunit YajC [Curtobacterium citreum]